MECSDNSLRSDPPAPAGPPPSPPPGSPSDRRPDGRHVLVVEDDLDVRELLVEVLGWAGYRVHAAASGTEALGVLAAMSSPPQLAIVDLVMPGMNGFELIRQMRRTPALAEVAVMVLTGMSRALTPADAPRVDEWLDKPPSIEDLLHAVDGLTGRS